MINVKRIEKEEWKELAGPAHQAVFKEGWSADSERIDYALITVDASDTLIQYATIKELDSDTGYIQYGGSFPNYRGSIKSLESFKIILDWLYLHYKYVSFLTENTNFPMLKFAIKEKFVIVGMRNFKGHIMLEHFKMKGE